MQPPPLPFPEPHPPPSSKPSLAAPARTFSATKTPRSPPLTIDVSDNATNDNDNDNTSAETVSTEEASKLARECEEATLTSLLLRVLPHLPQTLLSHLLSPSYSPSSPSHVLPSLHLPSGSLLPTPLLFVDISGFTKMSTVLAVNDLSIVINFYFTLLIKAVQRFQGDVIKFAGDAIFCAFPTDATGVEDISAAGDGRRAPRGLLQAVACGEEIVQTLSDFSPPQFPALDARLNVHAGIAYDECSFQIASSLLAVSSSSPRNSCNYPSSYSQTRRAELLVYGPVIAAVAEAEVKADLGEVHCCQKTQEALGLSTSLLSAKGTACRFLGKLPDPLAYLPYSPCPTPRPSFRSFSTNSTHSTHSNRSLASPTPTPRPSLPTLSSSSRSLVSPTVVPSPAPPVKGSPALGSPPLSPTPAAISPFPFLPSLSLSEKILLYSAASSFVHCTQLAAIVSDLDSSSRRLRGSPRNSDGGSPRNGFAGSPRGGFAGSGGWSPRSDAGSSPRSSDPKSPRDGTSPRDWGPRGRVAGSPRNSGAESPRGGLVQPSKPKRRTSALDSLQNESDLRPAYTVFTMVENTLPSAFSEIMDVATSVSAFSGTLRQFIVDDKGTVLIFNFGLRGTVGRGMVDNLLSFLVSLSSTLPSSRTGATHGDVFCGMVGSVNRHEYAVMGPSVNLAARLMCAAATGEVVVSGDVVNEAAAAAGSGCAGAGFSFTPMGEVNAKGFEKPVRIFSPYRKAAPTGGRRDRGRTRTVSSRQFSLFRNIAPCFVGRSTELATLTSLALSGGVACVTSEGGIGKTALAKKVRETLACPSHSPKFDCFQGACGTSGSLTHLTYAVFRRVFKGLLEALCCGSPSDLAERVPYSKGEFGREDFAAAAYELFCGLRRAGKQVIPNSEMNLYVAAMFQARPTVNCCVVLDDASFMDAASLSLLATLSSSCPQVFFLLTSRDHLPGLPGLVCGGPAGGCLAGGCPAGGCERKVHTIKIDALSKEDIGAMIEYYSQRAMLLRVPAAVGASPKSSLLSLPASHAAAGRGIARLGSRSFLTMNLLTDVFNISGGSPMFALSVLKLAIDCDLIGTAERGGGDVVVWKDGAQDEAVQRERDRFITKVCHCSNINDLIVAQIDELDPHAQNFAKSAAIAGAAFSESDLVLLDWTAEEAQDFLEELEEHDVVERDEEECGGWKWKQQLWHATVYNMMISPVRTRMHLQLAERLQGGGGGEGGEDIQQILRRLHHWSMAERSKEASEAALEAGEWFSKRGLLSSELEAYEAGLEAGLKAAGGARTGGEEVHVRLLTGKAKALAASGDKAAAAELYKAALAAYERAGSLVQDRSAVFPVVSGVLLALEGGAISDDESGSFERRVVERFVASAREHGDRGHTARAVALKGAVMQRLGMWEEAVAAQEELEKEYDVELSRSISRLYGSDRAAQSFSMAAQWRKLAGRGKEDVDRQVEKCLVLLESPSMEERRNVHNKFMIIFPLACLALEEQDEESGKEALVRALDLWERHLLQPHSENYDAHYDAYAQVFFKSAFKPVSWLLRMRAGAPLEGGQCEEIEEYLVQCGEEREVVRSSSALEAVMAPLGRSFKSVAAELRVCRLRSGGEGGGRGAGEWCEQMMEERTAEIENERGLAWERLAWKRLKQELK